MRSRYVDRRLFSEAAGAMGREDLAGKMPEEAYPEEYAQAEQSGEGYPGRARPPCWRSYSPKSLA
jgi:hypothetical protein